MHAIRNSQGNKVLTTALVVAMLGWGSAGYAQTSNIQFSAEADSNQGNLVQTTAGLLQTSKSWGPDDQSITITSGSNSQSASSINDTNEGVTEYSSDDDENSTDADETIHQANAASSAGAGGALGGLITWSNYSIQLTCNPDGSTANQINCTTYESISNLMINGQPAGQAGSFAAGTSIPVSGNITDTNCPLGVVSFSGNLVLDNSIVNSGAEQGSDTEIAMQITGTATCKTANLVTLYTTAYNEQIGGPEIKYIDDEPEFVISKQVDDLGY